MRRPRGDSSAAYKAPWPGGGGQHVTGRPFECLLLAKDHRRTGCGVSPTMVPISVTHSNSRRKPNAVQPADIMSQLIARTHAQEQGSPQTGPRHRSEHHHRARSPKSQIRNADRPSWQLLGQYRARFVIGGLSPPCLLSVSARARDVVISNSR
jgi:hypothetical protein